MKPILAFGRHILNQIETGITKEWFEANGLGSYAMGTIVGANTRRYHALFVTTQPDTLRRNVLVNRVEESVLLHGRRIDCSCQEYPGSISPQGHLYLESFSFDPFPKWIYCIDDLKFEKTFFLRSGEETAVLIYKHLAGPPAKLILRPFFSCRDHNTLAREDARFKQAIKIEGRQLTCNVPGIPEFFVTADGRPAAGEDQCKVYPDGYWYKNLVYAHEEERELDYQEDLFSPCQFHTEFSLGEQAALVFSDHPIQHVELDKWVKQEYAAREKTVVNFPIKGNFARRCALAADQFVIRVKGETRLLRGYPWYDDAVRETMMSLPGIFIAAGRLDEAKSIIFAAAALINNGLLPKRFSSSDPHEYDTADGALWFIWAAQKYWETTKDIEFLKQVKPHVEKIVTAFQNGIKETDPKSQLEIRMDTDGLIWAASNRCGLTWMNAKVNDWTATPRKGKPVELQALWYNALQFCSEICLKIDNNDPGWSKLGEKVRDSFNTLFWNSQNNYLYDVIDGTQREGSVRPNALFAISLPYEILQTDRFKPVVETAWRALYTSFGLRTLAHTEPHYHSIAVGDEKRRISAAYNGTVFPFLIGPFLTAFFKTYGRDEKTKEEALHFLTPFVSHLSDMGLGTISEMFDGNSPHNPRGAVADARAVAEILRVMKEEGMEL